MLGFCILCILGSNGYSGVVPRIHPISFRPVSCSSYRIRVLRSAWSGVGPMHFPIRARYLVSCFFVRTLAKCTAAVSDRLTDKLTSTLLRHSCPVSRMEDRHISALLPRWLQWCDGEEALVMELPTSSCHEILYPRFYGFVGTFSCKPPRGSRGEVLLSPRVWKGFQWVGH